MKGAHSPLASFQQYQLAFTQHLRDAKNAAPAGVVKKRMAVYQEIVFNNLFQAVSSCFPVAQQVLGKRRWQKIIRLFFSAHATNSPFFRDIPAEFLAFLTKNAEELTLNLPDFFISLCHYEWIELALTTRESIENVDVMPMNTIDDLLNFKPAFSKKMALLAYEYPVHQISAKKQPTGKTPTYLLVYQNAAFNMQFIALNAVTYQLIALLKDEKLTGNEALLKIAENLQQPNPAEIRQFGLAILEDFAQQGLIVGVYSDGANVMSTHTNNLNQN